MPNAVSTNAKIGKGNKSKRRSLTGKGKYARYRGKQRREHNKLKRIMCSQGQVATVAYAEKYGLKAFAVAMIRAMGVRHRPQYVGRGPA